jgi:hypothetical protein
MTVDLLRRDFVLTWVLLIMHPYRLRPGKPSLLAFSLLEGHPCWAKCGRRTRPF